MRKQFGWRFLLSGALMVGATISACQCYPDPELVVQPPAPLPVVARKVSGVFVDAKSGLLVTKQLDITIRDSSGALVSGIKDVSGKSTNKFTLTNGVLSFSIDPAKQIPLQLSIVAHAAGYNSTSERLEVTKDGAYTFLSKMVSIANPPVGVESVQQDIGTADSTGTLSTATTVQTQPEANTGASVEVTIPAGTQIKAADGTPLAGSLTATTTFYNNQDATSLSAFPGGLEVAVPAAGGGTDEGAFISAGFTAIEITDSSGNVASTFSKPVDVTMTVPDSTINPTTKLPVAAGDPVPFWSYNETTATWKGEPTVQLTAGTSGLLVGTGKTTHLSYFNLDWFGQRCNTGRDVVISGNPQQVGLYMRFSATGGGYVHEYQPWGGDPNTVHTFNAPQDVPMTITAFFGGNKVGETQVSDMCVGGDIALAVTMPAVSAATLTVHAHQACSDDPTIRSAVPTATVVLVPKAGGAPVVGTTDANGDATFSGLVSGTAFNVSVYAPNSILTGEKSLVKGANELDIDQIVTCQIVSGANGGNR